MWGYVIAAVVALCTAWLVCHFWQDICQKVAEWLRQHNLDKSILMDAWVKLDRTMVGIRSRIFIRTARTGNIMITEENLSLNQIDDSEVRAELERQGCSSRNIMAMLN